MAHPCLKIMYTLCWADSCMCSYGSEWLTQLLKSSFLLQFSIYLECSELAPGLDVKVPLSRRLYPHASLLLFHSEVFCFAPFNDTLDSASCCLSSQSFDFQSLNFLSWWVLWLGCILMTWFHKDQLPLTLTLVSELTLPPEQVFGATLCCLFAPFCILLHTQLHASELLTSSMVRYIWFLWRGSS